MNVYEISIGVLPIRHRTGPLPPLSLWERGRG